MPPPEWYWEAVEAEPSAPPSKTIELPIPESALRRSEGAARVWDELPAEARERLRRDGTLVLGTDLASLTIDEKRSRSFGAFYSYLRDQRLPHVVTLDALFALVHLGLVQALADVDEAELAPTLQTFVEKSEARLGAEQAGVGTELVDAYRIARGVVAVARVLQATTPYTPPRNLAASVAAERELIEAAGGVATSPLLGIPLDYTRFAAPDGAARSGAFRALAWLGAAPLMLVARTEAAGATVGAAQARTNARAAMLLARVCDHDIDAEINASYTKIHRVLSFVWGSPDDLSLTELDDVAEAAGVDLTNPKNIANVVRVDRVRMRALTGRAPSLYDGTGGLTVRVFGGHAAADSIALQSVVAQRGLPSTLDLAVWLGAPEARAMVRDTLGDNAPAEYDGAMSRAQEQRKKLEDGTLHASVHGSYVDALIAWANATPVSGITRSTATDRMRVESILAAWTLARHLGQPLARAHRGPPKAAAELQVSGQPLPVLIEPAPEVIARLVALVRQIRRGLGALGSLPPSASSTTALVEIEDILKLALAGAQREAADTTPTAEEATTLASLPARIARLEDDAGEELGPVSAAVVTDADAHRVLTTATGRIEPALILARSPGSDEPLLVVGAHVAHHEIVDTAEANAPGQPLSLRDVHPTLATAAIASRGRAPWVTAFRWTR